MPVSRQRTQSETRSRIPVAMQRSEAPARAQADGAPRGRVAQRPPVDWRAITPPPGPQFTERRAPSPPVPAIQRRIALHTQRGPSVQGGGYEVENYSSPRAVLVVYSICMLPHLKTSDSLTSVTNLQIYEYIS